MRFRRFVRALWLAYLYLFRPQILYDLMGLVRGPDFSATRLKWVFTGWARHLLFPSMKVAGRSLLVYRSEPLTRGDIDHLWQELKVAVKEDKDNRRGHFLIHLTDGFWRLESLPFLTKEERNEVEALGELASYLADCFARMPPFQTLPSKEYLRKWYEEWFGDK